MIEDRKRGDAEAALRYLAARRAPIAAALGSLAEAEAGEASGNMGRIAEFCLRGKMIRGCLVYLGAEAARDGALDVERLSRVAAAMELFQAGLLAHDDIMDRDETRRGAPTIHARYAAEAEASFAAEADALARDTRLAEGEHVQPNSLQPKSARLYAGAAPNAIPDFLHVGEALGICLGDLCYFAGFAELSRALVGDPRAGEILALCASGLSEVAVAQMSDVRWGGSKAEVPEEEILAMYRRKTARYTFSLPLSIGALVAGGRALVPPLTELGERLGILFQIRDDELGLFGNEARTGKGVGSDLREGKKTLFRARLLAAAPREERPRLGRLFAGGAEASADDLAYIRRLAEEHGVAASISELTRRSEAEARALIAGMGGIRPETAEVLEALVEYVTRRDR